MWGGGGILLDSNWSTLIKYCTISNNNVYWGGGGIGVHHSMPIIHNCNIINNYTDYHGGGIFVYNYIPPWLLHCDIFNCIIAGNHAGFYGGAVYFGESYFSMNNCVVYGNSAIQEGGGIMISGDWQSIIRNSIIQSNINGGLHFSLDHRTDLEYNSISGNAGGNVTGYPPTNLGELVALNANGDSCDIYNNIFLDAMFLDTTNYDFHLMEESPCIDAGNPSAQYYDYEDPVNPGMALYPAMGTIINDMGIYGGQEYSGWVNTDDNIHRYDTPDFFTLFDNYPNPFNNETTFRFDIPCSGRTILTIYNTLGQEVAELINEDYQAGTYTYNYNATDLANGLYFAVLRLNEYQDCKKIVLIK
jgi:hypothetical protein